MGRLGRPGRDLLPIDLFLAQELALSIRHGERLLNVSSTFRGAPYSDQDHRGVLRGLQSAPVLRQGVNIPVSEHFLAQSPNPT